MKYIYYKGVTNLMSVFLLLGTILVSCSNDESLPIHNELNRELKLKVSTTGVSTSPFTKDFKLLVYNDGEQIQLLDCSPQTKNESVKWNITPAFLWQESYQNLDFFAYFPGTATNDGLSFTLPADQSNETKLEEANYMSTEHIYNLSWFGLYGSAIDLNFNRHLVKIVMNVEYGYEYNDSRPTLSMERIVSQASGATITVNADNSTMPTVIPVGEAVLVKPLIGTNSNDNPCYTAIVTPCAITSGSTTLMTLVVNGELHQAIYKGPLTSLESGKVYYFNLKVGLDDVEITSASVSEFDNWGDSANEEDIL